MGLIGSLKNPTSQSRRVSCRARWFAPTCRGEVQYVFAAQRAFMPSASRQFDRQAMLGPIQCSTTTDVFLTTPYPGENSPSAIVHSPSAFRRTATCPVRRRTPSASTVAVTSGAR